jgi:hypothetical protein
MAPMRDKDKYRDLSTAAAKSAAFGRDDGTSFGSCFWGMIYFSV